MIQRIITRTICLLACWTVWSSAGASVEASSPAPTYWKHRQFYIPYQLNQRGKLRNPIAKVELLISKSDSGDWTTLEEAKPDVQGFSYQAPSDGVYWFALRHVDQRGQPWPNAEVQPQMHLVIDTERPELTLEATHDANGEAVVRYEARDANLQAETLMLEVRTPGKAWTAIRVGEPDITQDNRLVGRVRWQPPSYAAKVEIRAAVADRSGHRANASTDLELRDVQPSIPGPTLGSPATGHTASRPAPIGTEPVTNPFAESPNSLHARLPSHDWPATNHLPAKQPTRERWQSPPAANPYSIAKRVTEERVPAQFVADGSGRLAASAHSGLQSLQVTPLDADSSTAPPLMDGSARPPANKNVTKSDNLWTAATPTADQAERVVNSRTFDIEYDLQSIGPWGVAKVELWGTADQGQTWRSFGVDPDNRSPMRVTVPGTGNFGFRILVDGANSVGATPPRPGDQPELSVTVDLQPPTAELLSTQLGTGNLADHLLLRWSATDTNLEPRPIALLYSSYPNGPWSTIASGLENTGRYTWRIERHVPTRFYLRLEARDVAGNVATYHTSSPVALARPQPTGRLKSVRPITSGN